MMNVHKLLEETLFECELYLGHALLCADKDATLSVRSELLAERVAFGAFGAVQPGHPDVTNSI